MPIFNHQKIACQQVLMDDSSVFSTQWSFFPRSIANDLTPEALLARYLKYLRATTLTLIRPSMDAKGIKFYLFGSETLPLISFLPPVNEGCELVIRICGGILVQRQQCHRGELRFGVQKSEQLIKVSLQLSDYCPLILGSSKPSVIRLWLYRLTQATIHKLVTIRFLSLLYHDLAGAKIPVQIVQVHEREGKKI